MPAIRAMALLPLRHMLMRCYGAGATLRLRRHFLFISMLIATPLLRRHYADEDVYYAC